MKKKTNRKPSYKKGGEAWVSEKMANLPMYLLGTEVDETNPPKKGAKPDGSYYDLAQNLAPENNYNWGQQVNYANPFMAPATAKKTFTNLRLPTAADESTPAAPIANNPYSNFGQPAQTNTVWNTPPKKEKRVDTKKTVTGGAVTKTPISTTAVTPSNIFTKPEIDTNVVEPLPVTGTAATGLTPEQQSKMSLAIVGDTSAEISDTEAQKTLDGFNKVEADAYTSENRQQQFFNPYGGYDLATSAGMLGQSIKEKSTLGIVGSSSKLLSGLGRNVIGGMGLANREQFIQGEYDDNVRDAQRPRTMALGKDGGYYQEGGIKNKWGEPLPDLYTTLKPMQMKNLRVDGGNTGTQVPAQFVDELGNVLEGQENKLQKFIADTVKQQQIYRQTQSAKSISPRQFQEGGEQPQEGQEQMMQQVAQALQGGAPPEEVMQQLIQAGVPEDQAVQMIQSIMQQLQGQQEQPQMQRGGYQEYAQYSDSYFQEGGEQQAQQPSAEQIIQAYAESIQQDPAQIMQQLQQMPPEEQQQAIQQMMAELQGGQQEQQVMQRGGQIAKKLTGEYTLEEGENPNVNSEIEHNEYVQTPDGKVTKAEGATHEKGGIEVELEPGTRIVSDHLKLGAKNAKHYSENFDLEVKANDTYAKVLKRFTTKSGLQKIVDEQERIIAQLEKSEEAAQGSTMSESTAALNKQFLSEKLNTLEQEKAPLEEARKALLDDVFNKQEGSKPASERSDAGAEFRMGGSLPEYQNGLTPYKLKSGEGFSDNNQINFYRQAQGLGYEGANNQGDIQRFMNKVRPQDILDYFEKSGQPLTAKHVDLLKKNAPWTFKNSGISTGKASAEYTSEEKSKLKSAYGQGDENGMLTEDYNNFILEGFADNKWDWRAPVVGLSPLAAAGTNKSQTPQITASGAPNPYQAPKPFVNTTPETEAQAEFSDYKKSKGMQLLNLPDQSPMMPDSLTGALKITRRYDRVDPMQLSANGQVAELQGQANTAMQNINLQPGAESAAAAANIAAITQQNIGKTYSEVNRANMAQDAQAQQFNAQVQMQEENARGADLKDYESKIYQAQAVTDANVRGYYNQLKAVDLANYNAVNNVNAMNQMYDHFGYTNNGVEQTGEGTKWNANDYLKAKEIIASTEKSKSKRTSKARFGGKKK